MKKRRYFNSPVISRREEITSASHPWASSVATIRNFKERALSVSLICRIIFKYKRQSAIRAAFIRLVYFIW